ncbi:hypothetical protein [Trichloromonas sp.]|uniref:hypothetical protein n=1 Tax=Trichloromonas sp. TaxID=3069249 RepID=UPI003D818C9E
MIKKWWFRYTLGTVLGGFAGLSLSSSVLPSVVSSVVEVESFFIRYALGDYAVHAALVWAFAGWVVAKTGVPKIAPIILGAVGLGSGFLLGYVGFGIESNLIIVCGVAGGGYGVIGGLLLGNVLAAPAEEDIAATDSDNPSGVVTR